MNINAMLCGECNGKCSFCPMKQFGDTKPAEGYLPKLMGALDSVGFLQSPNLVIYGGEPTLSDGFDTFLKYVTRNRQRYNKIVLYTNGTKLLDFADQIGPIVDRIHIMRPHYDEAIIDEIFEGKVISSDDLRKAIRVFSKHGTETILTGVLSDKLKTVDDVYAYIDYSKRLCTSSVQFITLPDTPVDVDVFNEKTGPFADYRVISNYLDRFEPSKLRMIDGVPVFVVDEKLTESDRLEVEKMQHIFIMPMNTNESGTMRVSSDPLGKNGLSIKEKTFARLVKKTAATQPEISYTPTKAGEKGKSDMAWSID